jgi:guanylate kinase
MRTLVLYGPPAAGKDTITTALAALDNRYRLYERLKVGGGRTEGYRIVDRQCVEQLRRDGQLLWENYRYGALYAVERDSLLRMLPECIPVVHLGQPEAIDAIRAALPESQWTCVHLWCPREVAAERLAKRGTGDVDERLRAWDETAPLARADLFIDTATTSAAHAARAIHQVALAGSA